VVPGFGPLADRAELQTFKSKIDATVSRATHLMSLGISKDRLMAELQTDDLGWQFNFTGSPLEAFYRELALATQR
jgi:hypothetical protein